MGGGYELSHRAALVEAATAVLNEYTPFQSHHKVSFHTNDTQPTPWILGQLERTDGTPIADSTDPLDRKLVHLKDASVRIRPFFLPMCATPWAETDANEFTDVDFDYAAILGYGIDQDGKPFLKALYFVPTDALLERQSPDENGVWKLPLATYYVHQLSLEPRNKFARFLYLIERICEAMEYQYDKMGYYYSNPQK